MFVIERLIDLAARRHGFDRVALRRRNLVSADAPCRIATRSACVYDSGDYAAAQDRALELADWEGFEARRAEARRRGRHRGIGLANYIELNTRRAARARRDHRATRRAGSSGDRHAVGRPGPRDQLRAARRRMARRRRSSRCGSITGDTDRVAVGGGSHSGRSMRLGAVVMAKASDEIVAKGRAHRRLAAGGRRGRHRIRGAAASPSRAPTARSASSRSRPPRSGPTRPTSCAGRSPASATRPCRVPSYPYGCAVCEVEVDPETGVVEIVRYTTVDDVGRAVNPADPARPDPRRHRPGRRPGAVGALPLRPGDGQLLSARSWTTRCRAPTCCRRSRPRSARCRRRPTRSACAAAAKAAPRRRSARGQRDRRRARRVRRRAYRDAGHAGARLARDPGRAGVESRPGVG